MTINNQLYTLQALQKELQGKELSVESVSGAVRRLYPYAAYHEAVEPMLGCLREAYQRVAYCMAEHPDLSMDAVFTSALDMLAMELAGRTPEARRGALIQAGQLTGAMSGADGAPLPVDEDEQAAIGHLAVKLSDVSRALAERVIFDCAACFDSKAYKDMAALLDRDGTAAKNGQTDPQALQMDEMALLTMAMAMYLDNAVNGFEFGEDGQILKLDDPKLIGACIGAFGAMLPRLVSETRGFMKENESVYLAGAVFSAVVAALAFAIQYVVLVEVVAILPSCIAMITGASVILDIITIICMSATVLLSLTYLLVGGAAIYFLVKTAAMYNKSRRGEAVVTDYMYGLTGNERVAEQTPEPAEEDLDEDYDEDADNWLPI